ncbi:hypothetical protein Pint_36068 [Pistacia integerrima]|uniref:Uncharacterized protein n=1 Tax=Pistacia integerrima TaxID=434235 RepID=A0ACC0XZC0_9ROSI|nr:hypothetical protein Pint_36068 [Pistacia integerrima]
MLPLCLIFLVFFLSLSGSLNALMTNVAVEVQPLSPGPGHLTGSLTGPGLKTLAGWQSPTTPLASLGRSEVIKLVEINRSERPNETEANQAPGAARRISFTAMAEIFNGAIYGGIRRAVVIGNGFSGAENQCIGLVRALGLSGRHILYRVTRPRGGINEWLHWLPVSLHNKVHYFIKRICGDSRFQLMSPKSGLSLVFEADAKQIAGMAHQTFEKDGPLLVVASGRDTISVASSIKRLAPENVFVIQVLELFVHCLQHCSSDSVYKPHFAGCGYPVSIDAKKIRLKKLLIQHPRSQLNRFDLVITPRHDYYPLTPHAQEQIPWFLRRWITPREPPDRHVVLTVGALHQVDSAALRHAASAWHDELAVLPKPLLVVNVGGPTSNCQYGADLAKQLSAMLQDVFWSCGSVRISFSRRTPEKVTKIIVKEFCNNPKVSIWDGEDPNPHMGHLAWADAFVITADSVSMLSEACSTGKPIYVVGAERCTWKFAEFQKSLLERGCVRPFTGKEDMSENWSYSPLNDLAEAASQVNATLAERGWRIHP